MKNEKKKIVYAEPSDYFPEDIRRKHKLSEFAESNWDEKKPSPAEYGRWGRVGIILTSGSTNPNNTWMISANGKMYDHASAFATFGFIDWRQRAKYQVGDIVFIYCTRPAKKVMYKCKVIKCDMQFCECVDDKKFWIDLDEYKKSQSGKYARLKLLEQVDSEELSLDALCNNGLSNAPQGPIKVSSGLNSYIDKRFNDYYSKGVFNDVDTEEKYHEGHIINTKVNRYERSSIARMKCIEYHGAKCVICGMDFGERYGSIGEGFIHVHHLKPLHSIGQDYVVDYKNDLIPVCPNCHAMIHRIENGESLSVQELKDILM